MANNNIDPESRDYDLAGIKRDPRFKQINKEALISFLVFTVHGIFLLINLVVGAKPYGEMSMTAGIPTWLLIQLVEFAVYIVVVFLMVDKVFKNMDVDPHGKIH